MKSEIDKQIEIFCNDAIKKGDFASPARLDHVKSWVASQLLLQRNSKDFAYSKFLILAWF